MIKDGLIRLEPELPHPPVFAALGRPPLVVVAVTGVATQTHGPSCDQGEREMLRVLQVARRALTRSGVDAPAARRQLANDLLDPRAPHTAARLTRCLGKQAERDLPAPEVPLNPRRRSTHE